MKIYGSAQWVDSSKNKEWYSLSVISQWDWEKEPTCFQNLDGHLISYILYKCTAINDTNYNRKVVTELTDDIKNELINMGYTLNRKYENSI